MLNKGFVLNAIDAQKVDELKQSEVFGKYIKIIATSPIYRKIITTYIEQINISPDINRLKGSKMIPDNVSNEAIKSLNEIFKNSIIRILPIIIAEVILMKEIEDLNIDEVINNIKTEEDVLYILGLASSEYYIEAEKLLSTGQLNEMDPLIQGLIEYRKRNNKPIINNTKPKKQRNIIPENKIVSEKNQKTETIKTKVDVTDRHIRL